MSGPPSPLARYLAGYPPELLAQAQRLADEGRLGETLRLRHGQAHEVRTDRALYDYVNGLKTQYLRGAAPLAKVAYDSKVRLLQQALGTNTRVSRVQGHRLTAKREIRIASLFKEAPASFLRMIAVHELAHLKEREHDKAFYALCCHMEPGYHQLEFDLRLWLAVQEIEGDAVA